MTDAGPLIRLAGVYKTFGSTKALSNVSLEIRPGEMVGLIGHNGAGKSTTMRTIAGEYHPDQGSVIVRGEDVTANHQPRLALALGIRTVYQELELPGSLQVREAAVFAANQAVGPKHGWRRRAEDMMLALLEDVFPRSGIRADQRVERLTISQRQMLVITLAGMWADSQPATCLMLDEPTSSLDAVSAKGLYSWLRRESRSRGLGVLVSTHKLNEVIGELDRAYVMVDGRVASEQSMKGTTRADLVGAMQRATDGKHSSPDGSQSARVDVIEVRNRVEGAIEIKNFRKAPLAVENLVVRSGEIVGIGGLEGQGQKKLLRAIFSKATSRGNENSIATRGRVAFVSGDRGVDGIFPLWDVESNMSISFLDRLTRFGLVARNLERDLVRDWHRRLSVKGGIEDPIVSLSGGTQQKVLVGRALAQSPGVLLLDDPTRGVDEETKLEIHALVKAQAQCGTAVLWYSTETAELHRCERVCVMSGGKIADEIVTSEVDSRNFEDRVLGASFSH